MKRILLILFFIGQIAIHAQVKVGDVKVPLTLINGETTMILNGAGLREKYFIDLYVLALYVKTKSTDPIKLMNANEPMAIRMYIVSGFVTSEKMEVVTDEGFIRSTDGNTAPIQSRIDQMKSVFAVKMNKGDIYDFVYIPEVGTQVIKNGILATTVSGFDFKKAFFGIWLYKKPTDSDIQDKLMGK